eukprot:8268398-Ditylum_brightwellii.AAC.1
MTTITNSNIHHLLSPSLILLGEVHHCLHPRQSLLTHYNHGSYSSATAMHTSGNIAQLPNSAINTIIPLTDANDIQDDNKTTNTSMRDILGFSLYSSLAHEMDTLTSNGILTVAESTTNATTTALNG